jgi:glycosyltransferase involved in cell wall biosynthesis
MPMNPQVSVIVPAYNRREMLRDAIDSVLAQRGVAMELIIVDDGSTDGTWESLQCGELARTLQRAPESCRVVTDRTLRCGPAAARNRGVALAGADYIAFLDSDDLWMPDKLSRQLGYMREHPEYPIAQTQELWMRDGRRVNPGRRHQKRAGVIFERSLRTCLVSPSAVMMRTGLFHEMGGFDEAMAACEDYDLWLRISNRHGVGLLDEAVVIRRAGHPDQLSATVPALDRFRIRALLKLMADSHLTPAKRRAAAAVLAEKCAIHAGGLTRRSRLEASDFYSALQRQAQALLDDNAEPDAGYWNAALDRQPMSVEPP